MDYRPDRLGTVLVFNEGVTREQAREALKRLSDVLGYTPRLNDFESRWGGPVWYIP
jgi:hypothetical protein